MAQNKYKRLAGNSILFAVGNLGSKLISFFMLPLYTWKLTQSDFGISDLVLSTLSLLLPIISLSVYDAVLRFSLDRNKDIKEVFSNSMFISMIGVVIMIFSIPLFKICNVDYSIYIISILIAQSFQIA